ncbi:TIR domain-containing protein [Rhodohalobacter mucosus]|uniref:MTH538 TIR-like domain n=1 Tax=Rhodohalobacter mucosus TaxID=2079485 RepID=A0A316TXJ9_9BACT|nr:TIR domain-containing protein [Rhodohalobacter mucosus]PWN08179.1 hypothetical protein DDZ15_00665 [Rhodohalobacter mucosus]
MATIVQTRDIFIAHGWQYSDHIHKLQEELDRAGRMDDQFAYVNHGNYDTREPMETALDSLDITVKDQMAKADVFLLPVDLYDEHKEWAEKELKLAEDMDMPVIVIRSYKNRETPAHLEERADDIIVFDPEEILRSVKNYG